MALCEILEELFTSGFWAARSLTALRWNIWPHQVRLDRNEKMVTSSQNCHDTPLLWKALTSTACDLRDWYPWVNDKTVAYRCIACSSFFSHAPHPSPPSPSPPPSPSSCYRWLIAVTTHCGGKWLPHRSMVSAGPICRRRSARLPRRFQGTSGAGWPPHRVTWWLRFMLAVTKLPGDWIRVNASSRFEQISAVIFVCPRGATADGFHSFSSYHIAHDWMWLKVSIHMT